jgi:hypothetical protein
MADIEVSSVIIPAIGDRNVIFEINKDHYLSSGVFTPSNVKKMNNIISIKTNDGNVINLNNLPEVVDKNYETLSCIYQFVSEEFKLKNLMEKHMGIQIDGGITFIVGKLLSIKKEGLSIVVRTVMNEVLVLVHKQEDLCYANFSFMKNYL